MDPRHLNRLKEEQQKAIYETKERIKQCESFKSDYKALQNRLKTLPDSVNHDIMVPFGKLAFMPGKIVHTNEVMVLLGDNWFAERSAKQAAEIAGRRMKELDKKVKELNDQMRLLEPRLGFTSDLQTELQGKEDVREIREEFDEEQERLWNDRHRESVKRQKEQERLKAAATGTTPMAQKVEGSSLSDEQLWARLDQLERQEAERAEMDSDEWKEEEEEDNSSRKKKKNDENMRRVSFADENHPKTLGLQMSQNDDDEEEEDDDLSEGTDSDDDDDDEEGSDADGEEEDSDCKTKRRTIFFSHTKTPAVSQSGRGEAVEINSPSDIYKLFQPPSILKKSPARERWNESSGSASVSVRGGSIPEDSTMTSHTVDTATHIPSIASSAQKAFSGQIVERQTQDTQHHTGQTHGAEPQRRVSKFRAKRMGQSDPS
ncbi:unconventional prefoldin RPB5 interactor [Aplysia californica]|uniref:Unconventional prefoldin RPB5 interactor n=1 Tax=Aplysia californica TaxID=6500 RepID=A0ABM0JXE2_APLCA|nr:unconventional prefoldin RPB5 interactor [Aplysia californica]